MSQSLSHLRAIFYTLAGYTVWVFGDTCTKLAGQAHMPASQIIVMSSFVSCLVIFAVTTARGQLRLLVPRQWKRELFRTLLYVALSFINVTSFTLFPLALVYSVLFSVPLWVTLGSAVVLREELPWRLALAILAGFGGVVLAVHTGTLNFGTARPWAYAVLALFPVFASANILLCDSTAVRNMPKAWPFLP